MFLLHRTNCQQVLSPVFFSDFQIINSFLKIVYDFIQRCLWKIFFYKNRWYQWFWSFKLNHMKQLSTIQFSDIASKPPSPKLVVFSPFFVLPHKFSNQHCNSSYAPYTACCSYGITCWCQPKNGSEFEKYSLLEGADPGRCGFIFPRRTMRCITPTCSRMRRSHRRSEERRVGKECRSRWSPYH